MADFLKNAAIEQDKYFQFKILIKIFRKGWHLCHIVMLRKMLAYSTDASYLTILAMGKPIFLKRIKSTELRAMSADSESRR